MTFLLKQIHEKYEAPFWVPFYRERNKERFYIVHIPLFRKNKEMYDIVRDRVFTGAHAFTVSIAFYPSKNQEKRFIELKHGWVRC